MSLSSITLTKEVLNQYYPDYKQHHTLPAVCIEYIVNFLVKIKRGYYSNGQLEYETPFVDGKPHGIHRSWHSNGQLEYEEQYVDGREHGIHSAWYSNGQLRYEQHFVNDPYDSVCTVISH